MPFVNSAMYQTSYGERWLGLMNKREYQGVLYKRKQILSNAASKYCYLFLYHQALEYYLVTLGLSQDDECFH